MYSFLPIPHRCRGYCKTWNRHDTCTHLHTFLCFESFCHRNEGYPFRSCVWLWWKRGGGGLFRSFFDEGLLPHQTFTHRPHTAVHTSFPVYVVWFIVTLFVQFPFRGRRFFVYPLSPGRRHSRRGETDKSSAKPNRHRKTEFFPTFRLHTATVARVLARGLKDFWSASGLSLSLSVSLCVTTEDLKKKPRQKLSSHTFQTCMSVYVWEKANAHPPTTIEVVVGCDVR